MEQLNAIITKIDDFVWGPVMLILLVGTGIFLTIRTRFLTDVYKRQPTMIHFQAEIKMEPGMDDWQNF